MGEFFICLELWNIRMYLFLWLNYGRLLGKRLEFLVMEFEKENEDLSFFFLMKF